jgi:anti-sigma factor RsiW
MTTRQISIDEDDFQAFVDGQLPPDRRRAVMAYLAAKPDEAARMGDYRALTDGLHLVFDEVLYEPLPKRLRVEHYRGRRSWQGRVQSWLGLGGLGMVPRVAAVVLALVASGAGGWWLRGDLPEPPGETPAMSFTRQATNAHMLYTSDLRHPVEFGAEERDSLMLWLSERLGQPVHAPDMAELGFTLVGGRLLPAADLPAAQLMYENLDGHRITLFIRAGWHPTIPAGQDGTVNFAGDGAVSMVYWNEGPLAYALLGALDREQLFGAAKIIQQDVERPILPTQEQTATAEKDAT